MISAGTTGLFRRAIVQSAPLGISTRRSGMAAAMRKAAGAPTAADPVAEVLARQTAAERVALRFGLRGGMAFGTQYGHAPLPPESRRDTAWSAVAPAIDLLIGATSHETALYVPLIPALHRVTRVPVVGRLLHRALVRSTTHATYTRSVRAFAARHRAAGGRATRYELTWAPTGSPFGAAHITDLPLLLGSRRAWGRTAIIGSNDWDDIERRGRGIRRIWADFARTGTVGQDAAAAVTDTITIF
jgi:para-nitrobenzyl esterase